MKITSDHLTIIGWFVIPAVTVAITYWQQSLTKTKINLEAQHREKQKEVMDILDQLNLSAMDFWLLKGDKDKSKKLSIIILGQFKKLEPLIPSILRPDLTDLRQIITGGDFDDTRRSALKSNDRKFHEITTQIENLKTKIRSS